jgi:1-acyl-sn-glycerol-3-phosphate acyltransferase
MLSVLTRRASAALRIRVEPVDEFGLDSAYELRLRPFFEAMCRNYLCIQVQGAEHVPAHGRALLVSNHSRALPWDGIMLRTALRLNHPAQRQPRWLVEDDQFHAPFLGTFVSRLGAVRACQENAERLLLRDELLAVFPEGKAEKRYSDRHKLQRFGRGGYVKLALRTGAPVIPVAIVGCEEPYPLLQKVTTLSKWVGLPLFALAPALPRFGPLGVPPVPSRWRILIGEPIREIARQDADATRDEGLIHELNECVRGAVQQLLDQALGSRN